MPSLQARIDQALDYISSTVKVIHTISLILIAIAAFLLALLFFHIYPPLVFLILLLALCAVYYVNSKKDAIAELIDETDEENVASSVSRNESSNTQSHHHTRFARRLIFKLVDNVLDVGRDYALSAPLVFAAVAVVAAIFKYNAVATTFTILAAVLLATICCGCHITKYLAHYWVDYFFDHDPAGDATGASSSNYPQERTPLLPKS